MADNKAGKRLFEQAVREGEARERALSKKGIDTKSDAFLKFQGHEIRSGITSTNRLKKLKKNVKKAQKKHNKGEGLSYRESDAYYKKEEKGHHVLDNLWGIRPEQ